MTPYLVVLSAYILGAIPFGYLIYRRKTGRDIRGEGSGNIGATNVARLAGKGAGAVTLLLDAGKGYLAVMLAVWFVPGDPAWKTYAAVAVLVGHMFPVFLRFRGGKGVAAALGSFAALAPWAVLATLAAFVIVLISRKYVSLAALVAAAMFPPADWIYYRPPMVQMVGSSLAVALIFYKHSANIQRLMAGTESKFHFRSTEAR
jgi:acyl phosphate:glycerol-3-phosphate acyltransferase